MDMLECVQCLFITEKKLRKNHEDTALDLTRSRTITGRQ